MRRLTLLPLLILPLLAAAQEERPAWSLPIEEVPVVTRRTMKEIGVQRTQLDSTVLHDNISLSMADVLTQNANLFIKSYGRATLATAEFRGTSPSHTQVTWNGMRINSPMLGTVDFSMIPAFFIDAATLLHGASSIGVTGGALGGAVVLGTRPSAQRGWQTQYVQGVGSFSTFDQYLRVSYGGQRWSASTRAVYSTSDNDFRYTNYDKMELVYGPDGAVVDTYHPVERNRSGYFRDLHLLQELYYNRGDGTRYGLSAWYLRSKRGLPFLSTDYRDDVTILNEQREQTLRAVASWERLRERLKLGAKLGYAYTASAYDFRQRNAQGSAERPDAEPQLSAYSLRTVRSRILRRPALALHGQRRTARSDGRLQRQEPLTTRATSTTVTAWSCRGTSRPNGGRPNASGWRSTCAANSTTAMPCR